MRILQHTLARIFDGTHASEAVVGSSALLTQLTDQVRRPELIGDLYFTVDYPVVVSSSPLVGPTYTLWPSHADNWEDEPLFVAIQSTALVKISGETLAGASEWILKPTNSVNAGVHAAQFQFQGAIESLTISAPSNTDGGFNGLVQIRVFKMPALTPAYVIGVT